MTSNSDETHSDEQHPSQAEGDDPGVDDSGAGEPIRVLTPSGQPSQAEGEDPRDEVHEVLDPEASTDI